MPIYHACIFAQYMDIQTIAGLWAEKCNQFVIVQHPAEGKTKRIHCHIVMDSAHGENWFRESGKKHLGEFFKRGNYWIATRVQKGPHAGKLLEFPSTLVYVLKGKWDVSFSKNISQELLDGSRLAWVDSAKNDKTGDSPVDIWTNEVLERFNKWPTYRAYEIDFDLKYMDLITAPSPLGMLLDDVRHIAYRILYDRQKIAPQAQFYKQVASSAFLRLMEKWGRLDEGIHMVLNLWK